MLPLPGRVYDAPDGKGFDLNQVVGSDDAAAFKAHGYSFVVRYIRRDRPHAHDLSRSELDGLLGAGLGVMAVQHVKSESSWVPNGDVGGTQGAIAKMEMVRVGFPIGAMCWLDLEGVAGAVPSADVIDFVNQWDLSVKAGGYATGLYVGFRPGIGASDLYHRLTINRYWRAGNLNNDQTPVVRGVCMTQRWRKTGDVPPSLVGVDFNVDTIRADAKGGRPLLFGPLQEQT